MTQNLSNSLKKYMEVNIVRLIEEQPLDKISHKTNAKLVSKLQETFTNEEQQLFLASFWCYQNNKKDDFVVDLDKVWEWIGFSQKRRCKELIEREFEKDKDYILLSLEGKQNQRGGHNKEKFMLSIRTFKSLCIINLKILAIMVSSINHLSINCLYLSLVSEVFSFLSL